MFRSRRRSERRREETRKHRRYTVLFPVMCQAGEVTSKSFKGPRF